MIAKPVLRDGPLAFAVANVCRDAQFVAQMKIMEQVHGDFVYRRRVQAITELLAARLIPNANVLDVGCGDGLISSRIAERRKDIRISGIDVLVRPQTHIPVTSFDGTTIPYANGSFDSILFVDVLHHTPDPAVLIREAARVCKTQVLIKDHAAENSFQHKILGYMDRIGNERFGVVLPYNYWSRRQWMTAFKDARLEMKSYDQSLHLYPWWADWLFGGSLQSIADLRRNT